MNLYLIERDDTVNYEEYDSAIVAAESEDDAKTIHPNKENPHPVGERRRPFDGWPDTWVSISHVKATYIGEAKPEMPRGVVLASNVGGG